MPAKKKKEDKKAKKEEKKSLAKGGDSALVVHKGQPIVRKGQPIRAEPLLLDDGLQPGMQVRIVPPKLEAADLSAVQRRGDPLADAYRCVAGGAAEAKLAHRTGPSCWTVLIPQGMYHHVHHCILPSDVLRPVRSTPLAQLYYNPQCAAPPEMWPVRLLTEVENALAQEPPSKATAHVYIHCVQGLNTLWHSHPSVRPLRLHYACLAAQVAQQYPQELPAPQRVGCLDLLPMALLACAPHRVVDCARALEEAHRMHLSIEAVPEMNENYLRHIMAVCYLQWYCGHTERALSLGRRALEGAANSREVRMNPIFFLNLQCEVVAMTWASGDRLGAARAAAKALLDTVPHDQLEISMITALQQMKRGGGRMHDMFMAGRKTNQEDPVRRAMLLAFLLNIHHCGRAGARWVAAAAATAAAAAIAVDAGGGAAHADPLAGALCCVENRVVKVAKQSKRSVMLGRLHALGCKLSGDVDPRMLSGVAHYMFAPHVNGEPPRDPPLPDPLLGGCLGEEALKNLAAVRMCASCGSKGDKLRRCKRCKKVWYCSDECKARDWELRHEVQCEEAQYCASSHCT